MKNKEIKEKRVKQKYKRSVVFQSYLALSPQIIGFLIFSIYPIYWVMKNSFTDFNGVSGNFLGFANYIDYFTNNHAFWAAVWNMLTLTVMKLILEIPLAFLLAMLLCSKSVKAKRLFNTLLFLPCIIGVVTAGMLFSYMFRTYNGLINNILIALGVIGTPVNWLGEKWTALLVIVLMSTWMTFPINMMYFCGAIAGVPQEIYESAKIDGCHGIHRIFSITLPMIAPTFKVILMLALNGTMKMMNEVMVLTNGGPQGKTNVAMLYLYNLFFPSGSGGAATVKRIGYASAGSIIITTIIGIITIVYLIYSRKADEIY